MTSMFLKASLFALVDDTTKLLLVSYVSVDFAFTSARFLENFPDHRSPRHVFFKATISVVQQYAALILIRDSTLSLDDSHSTETTPLVFNKRSLAAEESLRIIRVTTSRNHSWFKLLNSISGRKEKKK